MSTPNLPENLPPRANTPALADSNKPRTRKGKKNKNLTTVLEGEGEGSDSKEGEENGNTDHLNVNSTGGTRDNDHGREDNNEGNQSNETRDSIGEEDRAGRIGNITGIGPDVENMAEPVQIEHGHAKWLYNIKEALDRDMM
ncbi:uncharacterized protein MELLADRAFT_104961 [Melampsora larici-populina 98AG31]|uniref:Uncharacterized protein n=1 Tax=Melampsora larici-populina (strain 98AG31 / pathotype 3-4-7) TaxID=747676 RepID=F4RGM6_MELLP|nr:uncharacterized protein MELLADRAFT_104961 [Melampsora larici-populina 98AG31]EGG08621.1 hypothetical protein MELLADRAFT_104961 [Melampsora larici-populina 98AG31]